MRRWSHRGDAAGPCARTTERTFPAHLPHTGFGTHRAHGAPVRDDKTRTTTRDDLTDDEATRHPARRPAFVVVWAGTSLDRLGQALLPDEQPKTFGRDDTSLPLLEQLPGRNIPRLPLDTPYLSRAQLVLRRDGERVHVKNVGRRSLMLSGRRCEEGYAALGDTVLIDGVVGFLVTMRPETLPAVVDYPSGRHRFGLPDEHGIVGESPSAWELRERVAFAGPRGAHVLVTGESGTGKELTALAIHEMSPRAAKKLVARNAATIPDTLIDAEMFGNLANYPNAGMPERKGLIGEADGSTLFLDEIGELPTNAQAHLLRVLDEGGEYHRLGEGRRRTADFRLIGATNRPPEQLKPDLLARLALRVHVHPLNERREDIPLLAIHLLRRLAKRDPGVGRRFFESWDGTTGVPRVHHELMLALVHHHYSTHVRELEALLWRALSSSRGDTLSLSDEAKQAFQPSRPPPALVEAAADVTREDLIRALEEHRWVREQVWRALGLKSRFVLHRLMKKHGIASKEADDEAASV